MNVEVKKMVHKTMTATLIGFKQERETRRKQ
jgi:hypothetical protein